MTEKEFENLKTGDKVWIFLSEPKETVVIAKQKDIGSNALSVQVNRNGVSSVYNDEYVYVTKAEAWEAEIKHEEKFVENNERVIEETKERIDRYKAELAKAKEEEENESGWTRILHNGKFEIAPCSKKFAYVGWFWKTQSEAFKALAEYYKGEYEEAMKKAEKTK